MRRTDIKLLVLVALVIGLLITIYSCTNPKDPVDSQSPAVAITNPVDDSRVQSSVDVRAEASDNTAVTKVEFYIDAQLFYTDETPPWSCFWAVPDEQSAEHTVFAKAFDAAGNNDCSELVTVTCETQPPAVIADLAATEADINGDLTLTWTAPGESGDVGTPALYDIRYFWDTLTVENWNSGTQLEEDVPLPQEAGSAESYDITGLILSSTYFFAIRTQDTAGNWSGISNNVMVNTPALLAAPVTYPINASPNPNIVVADLNDDLVLDLVVSHRLETDNVSVLIGNGDGTFQTPVSYTVVGSPGTFCALDVDNDLDLDFAVTEWDVSSIIYTSMSTSTDVIVRYDPFFGAPFTWTDTIIYFSEEHVDDLATLCMLTGDGDGTLTDGWESFADTFFTHCLNSFMPDVYILEDADSCWCTQYDSFYYENPYYMNGWEDCMDPDSNVYFPQTPLLDWTYEHAIANCAGDFNNDGYADAVFAHYTMSRLGVLFNDGAGELLTPEIINNGGIRPTSVCTGDFDADGWLDLAVANSSASDAAVLLNEGGGIFTTIETSNVGDNPSCIISGDFDGDGDLDIATANYDGASVSILYNQGDGTFPASPSTLQAGWGPSAIASADLTGDGTPELVVTNFNDDDVTVLINEGLYRYYSGNSVYVEVGDGPGAVGCGDFDGDGDNDVVVVNQNDGTVSILLNQMDY